MRLSEQLCDTNFVEDGHNISRRAGCQWRSPSLLRQDSRRWGREAAKTGIATEERFEAKYWME